MPSEHLPDLSRTGSRDAPTTSLLSKSSISLPSTIGSRLKNGQLSRFSYPLDVVNNRALRDISQWEVSVAMSLLERPLYTEVDQIPSNPVILDLACGSGYWCIRAAMFWKNAHVVGLDIAKIQPDLRRAGYEDLARRITWHHADMLEPLPFIDNYFDVVQLSYSEYCVPEKKWMDLLKEIRRILKRNGVFEMRQQTCAFLCPKYPPRAPSNKPPDSNPILLRYGGKYEISRELHEQDPRDHKRLKAAYDAMLLNRSINPSIISALPLYLEAQFETVQISSTLSFPMPESSFIREDDGGITGSPQHSTEDWSDNDKRAAKDFLSLAERNTAEEQQKNQHSYMHLNLTMHNILACREAIWDEFKVQNPKLTWQDFEFLLKNWEMDMRDRINLKAALEKELSWHSGACGEDGPDGKAWRDMASTFHKQDGPFDARPILEPCRSIRLFRGIKLTDEPIPEESVVQKTI